MHALASHLKTSVAAIERGMSAREFGHWQVWLDAERIGPAWDRVRHAELMAAIHNGACTKRGGGTFDTRDFLPDDPWVFPVEQDAATIARELKRMEGSFL